MPQKSSQSKSAGPQPNSEVKKDASDDEEVEQIKKLKAQVAEFVHKIIDHYNTIERVREEDRRKWKEYSQRLEALEEVKSQRGKKRKYRKKKVEQTNSDVMVEEKCDVQPTQKFDVDEADAMMKNRSKEKSTQAESKKN